MFGPYGMPAPGPQSRLCCDVLGVSALDVINTRLMHY